MWGVGRKGIVIICLLMCLYFQGLDKVFHYNDHKNKKN
jgi:hypothetical protein